MGHLKDGQREVWFCLGGRAVTGLLSWCPCHPGLTGTGRLISCQVLFPLGRPQREPRHKSRGSPKSAWPCSQQLPPSPTHIHIVPWHCPVAGSNPWPGVTCAEGCTWACWLIHPWPLAEGPPAQAATREGRGGEPEPRQTGLAIWSIGLSLNGSLLGGRGWRSQLVGRQPTILEG